MCGWMLWGLSIDTLHRGARAARGSQRAVSVPAAPTCVNAPVRHEPALDRGALIAVVRAAYGFEAAWLAFVPVGYAAACYELRDGAGQRRFLKLWPDTGAGRAAAARLDATLPLLVALDRQGIRVPAPIPTLAGALAASFGGQPFALFPFVRGRAPP